MEPLLSMQVAASLLGVAALGGLVMAVIRLRGTPQPPAWLAMVHGLLAAAALTLLVYAALTVGVPGLAQAAIAFLVVAAVGGVAINLLFHWKLRPLPVGLVLVHALLAAAGFVLLLLCLVKAPASG